MKKSIITFEPRYLTTECEATSVHDVNDKLKQETVNKYFMPQNTEDKSHQLEKCLKSDNG